MSTPAEMYEVLMDLAAMKNEELHPDLIPYLEEHPDFGTMLRHPLAYMLLGFIPGMANKMYTQKKERLAEAIEKEDWHSVVFLHERPHRFAALVTYCTGLDDEGSIIPLREASGFWKLAADVWMDSENIEQNEEGWRDLLDNGNGIWLGSYEDDLAFDELPDLIPAYRGGISGDWSWTTERSVAEFFANRFNAGRPVREALIPKEDCFGYLTGRGEYELLVRFTPERAALVYPC